MVKGIQFEGVVLTENHFWVKNAAGNYHKKYPVALAMQGEIRTIQINSIKMTDNSLGFGKKITWMRKEEVVNAS